MGRRASNTRFAQRAFTLIELLVVTGIIAILLGVLLPSLAAARRSAQLTKCLAIERQIGLGAFTHSEAHRGFFPLAGHFKGLPTLGGASPAALNDRAKLKYAYMNVVNDQNLTGTTLAPWHAAVALQLGKKNAADGVNLEEMFDHQTGTGDYLKYFLCPSHRDTSKDAAYALIYRGGSYNAFVQQSYIVNEVVFGIDDTMGRLRGQKAKVRRPSQTVMLADGLLGTKREYTYPTGTVNWATFVNKVATPPVTLADALLGNYKAGDNANFDTPRHKNKVNILFMDGHAETRVIDARDLQDVFLLAS